MATEEKELLNEIVAKITELHGKATKLKGKNTVEIITAVLGVLPDIVKEVEIVGDKLASADKKNLAIEAALKWANIKLIPDAIERKLIGLVIDFVIGLLNKWFGKEWISKVTGFIGKIWSFIKKIF